MAFVLDTYSYDVLKRELDDFLYNSEASTAMLLDRGGNTIISSGEDISDRGDLISALVAGAFAATQELASVLEEHEFSAIYHEGATTSIFISAIGDEVLLLTLFGDNTTVGLVKMYAMNTCRRMSSVITEVMAGDQADPNEPTEMFVLKKGPLFRED